MKYDLIEAHHFCFCNQNDLANDKICGCFYCGSIFNPALIEEYHWMRGTKTDPGTAICPYCEIDAIIGESSGFPIEKEFLYQMHQFWFGRNPDWWEDS